MTLITSAGTWCLMLTLHLPSHDPPHASPHASPPPLLDIHPVDPCPVSCFVLSAGPGFPLVSLPPFPHSLPSLTRASSSSSSFFSPPPRYHSRTSYTNPTCVRSCSHFAISPSHLVVFVVFVFVLSEFRVSVVRLFRSCTRFAMVTVFQPQRIWTLLITPCLLLWVSSPCAGHGKFQMRS